MNVFFINAKRKIFFEREIFWQTWNISRHPRRMEDACSEETRAQWRLARNRRPFVSVLLSLHDECRWMERSVNQRGVVRRKGRRAIEYSRKIARVYIRKCAETTISSEKKSICSTLEQSRCFFDWLISK